jgi:AGZA family xanthine/uracil permease-like MFS transporter
MKSVIGFFKIKERNSSVNIEVLAGVTTFMTMSYIIFLQPAILSGALTHSPTGMDVSALTVGVCLAAAIGSMLMGLLANYPIALAPGMGENFFFVSLVGACVSMKIAPPETAWQTALGVVFISGAIFLLISFFNIRGALLNAISPSLRHSIAAGIGLFIALLGLKNGHIIQTVNGSMILNSAAFTSVAGLVFCSSLIVTSIFYVLKVRGAVLCGIIIGTLIAFISGVVQFNGVFSIPPSVSPVFAKIDLNTVYANLFKLLPFIIIFTFMDVFDTLGTLVGIGMQAGIMKNGKFPNQKKAFAADSLATMTGVFFGQSTVTSYIESSTGVKSGGRTGLTALVVAICFIIAVFFTPLIKMIADFPPITAAALVFVGALMMSSAKNIDWDDAGEAIPAFLIMAGIPFTSSIADGIMLGLIVYPIINLFTMKRKTIGWLTYFLSFVMLIYLILVRTGLFKKFL